jgi:hypothetical protein
MGALFCHCKRCQRRSGSGFSVTVAMVPGWFRLTNGAQPPEVSIGIGPLDGDPGTRASVHQFTAYVAPCLPIPDDRLPHPAGLRPPDHDD